MKLTTQSLIKHNQPLKLPLITPIDQLKFSPNKSSNIPKTLLSQLDTSTEGPSKRRKSSKQQSTAFENQTGINIQSIKIKENRQNRQSQKQLQTRKESLVKYPKFNKPISKKSIENNKTIEPDFQLIYKTVNLMILHSYGLTSPIDQTNQSLKAFVDKGNNSVLVKQTIKGRGWWNISTTYQEQNVYNLIWTEFRQKQYLTASIPKTTSEQKLTIKNKVMSMLQSYQNILKLFIIKDSVDKLFTAEQIKQFVKKINDEPKSILQPRKIQLTNHIPENHHITNKKALFKNLHKYYQQQELDPFLTIPITYHVNSIEDEQFTKYLEFAETLPKKRSLWVIKPGQNTNRGNGICVKKGAKSVKQYLEGLKSKHTHIIQIYIRPYLYCERKFDIRCYMLVTLINKKIKGYWYEQGYIRTTSETFTYKKMDKMIHLTNDAVQKHGQNYGKYEPGNKISYQDLAKYMLSNNQVDFIGEIVPKMKNISRDILLSTKNTLGGDRSEEAFEIYGLDFMIDQDMKPWLIQVNTNPCLELSSSLLSRVIPQMLENALRIGMDPFLNNGKKGNWYESMIKNNKFELIFEN